MMADGWVKRLGLAAVIAVAGLGYWGGWWDQLFGSPPIAHIIPGTDDSLLRSFRSKLAGWNDRQRTWEITAEQIWQSANAGSIYFEAISQGLIFSDNGKIIDFKGDWARWEKNRNRLVLGGNLEVRFNGNHLTTAELCVDYHSWKLTTPGEVVIRGEDLWLRAGCMIMDLQAEKVHLEQGVKLMQRGNVLRAKGLEIDLANDQFELIEPEGLSLTL